MKRPKIKRIWRAAGDLDAQIIKNYLESYDIKVILYEESIGKVFGFTSTPLGEVEVYVPADQEEFANKLLSELYD